MGLSQLISRFNQMPPQIFLPGIFGSGIRGDAEVTTDYGDRAIYSAYGTHMQYRNLTWSAGAALAPVAGNNTGAIVIGCTGRFKMNGGSITANGVNGGNGDVTTNPIGGSGGAASGGGAGGSGVSSTAGNANAGGNGGGGGGAGRHIGAILPGAGAGGSAYDTSSPGAGGQGRKMIDNASESSNNIAYCWPLSPSYDIGQTGVLGAFDSIFEVTTLAAPSNVAVSPAAQGVLNGFDTYAPNALLCGRGGTAQVPGGSGKAAGGGGGGAGGVIIICADTFEWVSGTLTANGGNGGNAASDITGGIALGGEGGAGGIVLVIARNVIGTPTVSVAGGARGTAATAGGSPAGEYPATSPNGAFCLWKL